MIKAWHIISVITWFSGLFYLPRLFVYHAMSDDAKSIARFKIMARKLYYGITWPSGIVATVLGLILMHQFGPAAQHFSWLQAKIGLVVILWAYHLCCGYFLKRFEQDQNQYSHVFYRWFNEFPVLILISTVILVVCKPTLW